MARLKDFGTYPVNPFRVDRGLMGLRLDNKTGKTALIGGQYVRPVLKEKAWTVFDKQDHVRIYNDFYHVFRDFSRSALDVFFYVVKDLPEGADEVLLSVPLVIQVMAMPRSSVYSGIIELVERGVLARKTGGDMYFINPSMFFKGSRSKWYLKTNKFDLDPENAKVVRIDPSSMKNRDQDGSQTL